MFIRANDLDIHVIVSGPPGAAPLLLLRTMLGLEPIGEHLIVDPALPQGIGRLELLDIPGRWGRVDAFGRGRVDVEKQARRQRQLGVIEDGGKAAKTRKK